MKANKMTKETIMDLGMKDRGFPEFRVGDTIQVAQKVKEGDKQRIQQFKGDVIAMHKNGVSTTFTVRRMGADSIGVERIFPFFAPFIDNIKVIKKGVVRRAKLFYIRDRIGKSARIKEKIVSKKQKEAKLAVKQQAQPKVEKTVSEEQGTETKE